MRDSHNHAPLHRIEAWSGLYFRPASLWEVGTYLLVPHHDGERLCDTLRFQQNFLDSQQRKIDEEEQTKLRKKMESGRSSTSHSELGLGPYSASADPDPGPEDIDMEENPQDDLTFEATLNSLLQVSTIEDFMVDDLDPQAAEKDIHNVVEYLGPAKNSGRLSRAPVRAPAPRPNMTIARTPMVLTTHTSEFCTQMEYIILPWSLALVRDLTRLPWICLHPDYSRQVLYEFVLFLLRS